MKRGALTRRGVLGLAAGAALARPSLVRAEAARRLVFVPQADLSVLDPVFTTAAVTTNHAAMVFDTLYGVDAAFNPRPQMVEGHLVEEDGLRWTLTLREGLKFHDGEPVRAADAAASIRRWGKRDMYGQALLERAAEITALDDRRLSIRLRKRFNALPAALGKNGSNLCVIMPERLAATPADRAVTEMVGSGPYRFLAAEALSGAHYAYERFAGYLPRSDGPTSRLAGPKIAHFDRVEWRVIPDAATAAAALQSGEVDWMEMVNGDLLPLFEHAADITPHISEDLFQNILRFNCTQPPFDNPAIRRALLGIVSQADYMASAYGGDGRSWKTGTGVFTSNGPMASTAGLAPLAGQRDPAAVKAALRAAGYQGEKVVLLQATDVDNLNGLGSVAADELARAGLNLDVQTGDWGSISQRRANRGPLDKGGWSIFMTSLSNTIDPGGHLALRANGAKAWFGWPDIPRIEELREAWFDAPDLASQQKICADIQLQIMTEAPYIPVGENRSICAARRDITHIFSGAPYFYDVRRES